MGTVAGTSVTSDISAIQGYLEKFQSTLIGGLFNNFSFANDPDIMTLRGLRTPTNLYKYSASKGARRLNTSIEDPKDKGKWSGRKITPYTVMKIMQFIPEELRESFQSEFLGVNDKQIPFARFVNEQEFMSLAAEIEDNFYNSVYADVVDYSAAATYDPLDDDYVLFNDIIYKCVTATNAGESPTTHPAKWSDADAEVLMDGIGTIIAKEITATNLTAFASGALDETDAYEGVKEMWKAQSQAFRTKGTTILYTGVDMAEDIMERQNTLFGSGKGIANADVEEGKPFYLKNTNKRLLVKPAQWMGTSRRLIMTKPKNLVFGTDQLSEMNKIGKMVDTLHGFKTIVKFILSCEIADLEVLKVNNQP